jgi:hypothetical protein
VASGYGRYISKDAMYTGFFGNGNLNGQGIYETFGKNAKKIVGKWVDNVLKESFRDIGFKSTLPMVPKVDIVLTPTVKSLSENMVKTPKLSTVKMAPAKKQQFNQMVATW